MINVTRSDLPELERYVEYLRRIWSTHWLTNDGELLQELQSALLTYLRADNLVLLANGTLALQLAVRVLQLRGEVITTPFTFAATTNVLVWEGLNPVFADIDSNTFNIDPEQVERRMTDRTSAILATHVYGNPCDVDELARIARRYNIRLMFDAAHAFGVEYNGTPVVKYGDISTMSFHATKVFNTIEGGAIVTGDPGLAQKLRLMRNHGIKSEEEVVLAGLNAKMNEFQAAMGLCNLRDIDANIERRKRIYEYYREQLDGTGLTFQELVASRYNYIYMPVCLSGRQKRDQAYSALIANGIKPRKYFYPLTSDFDYFRGCSLNLLDEHSLSGARSIADRVLCLPLYPDLDISVVEKTISVIRSVVSE